MFKQKSPYYEHFYKDLQPWKHYIPLTRNLSDLIDKILWTKDHDEESMMIGKRGSAYARSNLMPGSVFCYYTLLLQQWAKLLQSSKELKELPDDFETVRQPIEPGGCDCFAARMEPVFRDELCYLRGNSLCNHNNTHAIIAGALCCNVM